MVGIIPKILLDLVGNAGGIEAVRETLERAKIPAARVFRLSEIYEDTEWMRLLEASCAVLQISESEALKAYAAEFGKDALERWPKWFEMSRNSFEFLLRQPKIHNYFASGVQDPLVRKAITDKFSVEKVDEYTIITHYRSPNRLCELYVHLAHWVIGHYRDKATVIHRRKCLKRGDSECEICLHWEEFSQYG